MTSSNAMIIAVVATVCIAGIAVGYVITSGGGSDGEVQLQVSESFDASNGIQDVSSWRSTDSRVAAVSAGGLITAVGEGRCTVIATSPSGGETEYKVNVRSPADPDVEIVQDDMHMAPGQVVELRAYVVPVTYDQTVTWRSTNTSVATVDENGRLTAVGIGKCEIIAYSAVIKEDESIDITVTENGNTSPFVEVDVEITREDATLKVGETMRIPAIVIPSTYDQEIIWLSSNPSVAIVSSDGTVTAMAAGKAEIRAINPASGEDDDIDIRVVFDGGQANPPVSRDIEILQDNLYLVIGGGEKLNVNQDVSWRSTNTSVATVDENGNVTAVGLGRCEIIAFTQWDDEDVDVYVSEKPMRIPAELEIYPDDLYLEVGGSAQLRTNQDVSWRSTNTSVATVDQNGNVTAVGKGRCEIIAYTQWDAEDVDVVVSDGKIPNGAELDIYPDEDLYLSVGETFKLTATQEVKWRSTNTSVATVDENGVVTAVGKGECEIIASNLFDDEDIDVIVR